MSNNNKIIIAVVTGFVVVLAALHFSGGNKATNNVVSQTTTTTSSTTTSTSSSDVNSTDYQVNLPITPTEDISSLFTILPSANVTGLKTDTLTDTQRKSIASAYLVTKFHALKALANGDISTYQQLSYVNLSPSDNGYFAYTIKNAKASGSSFKFSGKIVVLGIIVETMPTDLVNTLGQHNDPTGQYEVSILIQNPVSLVITSTKGQVTTIPVMPAGAATSLNIFSTGDLDTTPGSAAPWSEKFSVSCDDINNPANYSTCIA